MVAFRVLVTSPKIVFYYLQTLKASITPSCNCKKIYHFATVAFTSRIPILSYFIISKNFFINYTIPFYNTSNISKLYYFTILLKYYFFKSWSRKTNIKKHYLDSSSLIFFTPLSLSLSLSLTSLFFGYDCASVRACEISGFVLWLWIVNSWYEFLLVVLRWVLVGYGG